ncbi:UNVERIFIED_ORG: hypothetical protein ABID33_002901 [Xanthobacter viscosus]|jgi:hypothetical protein|uniref:Glycerophosphoryl diester phosphodiesterase membrane domain-containing protein n=1 Tax=Xanthobacter autotrophicus TaxID=280 RepID=A0A6C1K9H5_XANAU|nr:hypothetical protein [Xanthobacter autotrophicus]TLX40955.1 hypothetical protein FBQ73_21155 [Xanthobacter autotrophicus]
MDHEKLPVFDTVKLALRWGVFVVQRHWLIILIFAVALVAISFAQIAVVAQGQVQVPSVRLSLLSLADGVLLSVLSIVIALLTHNEVLRGAAGLNAQTLGWGAGRVVGYALDSLVLMLFGLLVMFPLLFAFMGVDSLFRQFVSPLMPEALIFVSVIGAWLAAVFVGVRLMLRLPSRALGRPIPWREAWRLGRGNSIRLFLANGLLFLALIGVALLLLAAQFLASMLGLADLSQETITVQSQVPIQGQWSFMANETFSLTGGSIPSVWGALLALLGNFLALAESVFFFALLSVSYAELKRIHQEPPALPRVDPRF